ncbi:hypothetical protein AB71190_03816 [Acinetobacter baumannii]|nr:hypothetical protein AB71190_03816 [Acinetobacter baumannii]
MLNAYIYDGLRSPFGRHAGELASIRPDDLAATVIQKLLEKTGVPGADIEDVILGDTNQAGEDSRNVARNALLLAGLPVTVPGQTVNRLCASGLGAKPNIKKPKKKVSLSMKLPRLRFSKAKNCPLNSFQKMNTLAQAQLLKHSQS